MMESATLTPGHLFLVSLLLVIHISRNLAGVPGLSERWLWKCQVDTVSVGFIPLIISRETSFINASLLKFHDFDLFKMVY